MTIKTIALGLMSAVEAEWLLPLACEIARSRDAHLIGVHPVETIIPYVAMEAPYISAVEPALFDWQVEESDRIHEIFSTATRNDSYSSAFRAQDAGAIDARMWLLESLRAADLVVLGRNDPEAIRPDDRRMQEAVIRDSGRPVLLLPKSRGLPEPAKRLLIGWSPTREATRAAHDSLALAAPRATIDLLRVHNHIATSRLELDSRQDLAAALDRHGYDVNLIDRDSPAGETAEILLRTAVETGADLVATGAYGHSRIYDFVIGAVTRHLVDHAEVPVLLSK